MSDKENGFFSEAVVLVAIVWVLVALFNSCGGSGLQVRCEEVDFPVPPVVEQKDTCLIYSGNGETLEPGDKIDIDIDVDIDINYPDNMNPDSGENGPDIEDPEYPSEPTPTPTPSPTTTPSACPKWTNPAGKCPPGRNK